MKLLIILCALAMTSCGPTKIVTRTQTVEIPRLKYVPVPANLTAPTIADTIIGDCLWKTLPTLCVGQLAERCDLLEAAVESCNADKATIQALQPE